MAEMVGPPKELFDAARELAAAVEQLQDSSLESSVGIDALAAQMKEQNKIAQADKTDQENIDRLNELVKTTKLGDSEGKAAAFALKQEFKDSNDRLQRAIELGDDETIALEKESQLRILEGAESEENRREAAKATNKQSKLLGNISKGIGGLVGFAKDNAIVAGGGVFAALALFNPELMEKIVNKLVEILSNAMKIIDNIVNGDIEGALTIFKENFVEFGSIFALLFGGKLIKMIGTIAKVFPKIRAAFLLFQTTFIGQYISGMMLHFKEMMRALGGKLIQGVRLLTSLAGAFRVTMMTAIIPAMLSALTGILTSMGAAIIPLLPAIGIGLAIAAVVGLIALGLTKLRDALGFSSVFDLMLLGAAYLKDGFAHIANFFIKIAKKIAGLGTRLLEAFGIEVPDFVKKLEGAELMATDNAAKKKIELRQKAEEEKVEQAAKELELAKQENTTGDDMSDMSDINAFLAEQDMKNNTAPPTVIQQRGGDVVTNTSNTAVRSYNRKRGWNTDRISSSYA